MSTASKRHAWTVMTDERHLAACEGDAWRARALALAEASHLTFRARWLTPHDGPLAEERFAVPSVSQPTVAHLVRYDAESEHIQCPCPAGTWGRPCRHSGSVVHYLIQYTAATRPRTLQEESREAYWDAYWSDVEEGKW